MAEYVKNIVFAGHSINVNFHGISESVLRDRHYSEQFKVYDDIVERFTRRLTADNTVTYGATVQGPTWNHYNELLYSYGDIISAEWDTLGNGLLFWSKRGKIVMPSDMSEVYVRDEYLPFTSIPDPSADVGDPFLAPFNQTYYPAQSVSLPTSIDLYGVAYFESEEDLNMFIEKWNDGELDTSYIKNIGEDSDQEEYESTKQYWFIQNMTSYMKGSSGRYDVKIGTSQVKVVFEPTEKRLYFTGTNTGGKNLILKNYAGVECDYSTAKGFTSWSTATTMPSTLAGVVKGTIKDGAVVHMGTLSTNIPIFADNLKGDEYEDGFIDVEEADNIDGLIDKGSPSVNDGESETVTTFGSSVAMDKMTMYYKMTGTQLATFGATLFNAENQDNVVAGTKLVGSDALNALIGLRYYPFDISKVCRTTGTYYIYLGSWDSRCASSGVITSNSGIIDIGSMPITPLFNSFLDYTNVQLSIYLPYIGIRSIDVKNVMNKILSIKYVVDITTGKCKALLLADGLLFDSHEGVIARDCPISGADAQSYNQAVRGANIAMNNAKLSAVSAITSIAGSAASGPSNFVGAGMNGGLALSDFMMNNELRMEQATQDKVNASNNLPTFFTGTSGGQMAELEPQYVYVIFAVNKVKAPANELNLVGKPSNTSGSVSQFYGYLSCDINKIETKATASERAMISSLLANGIYI